MLIKHRLNADLLGVAASSVCMLHCMATPFVFAAKVYSSARFAVIPDWWHAIDYLFLVISGVAIFYTAKQSSIKWLRVALWFSWVSLLVVILDETLHTGLFPELLIYLPALAIVGLHLYNLKYCRH